MPSTVAVFYTIACGLLLEEQLLDGEVVLLALDLATVLLVVAGTIWTLKEIRRGATAHIR